MPNDIIFVHGLKLQTIIGCLPWEKQNLQTIIIDVDMQRDTDKIIANDDIKHTVDYAEVVECIKAHLKEHRYNLVETLAEQLANLLLKSFPLIAQLTLKISKPEAIAQAQSAGVIIRRTLAVRN